MQRVLAPTIALVASVSCGQLLSQAGSGEEPAPNDASVADVEGDGGSAVGADGASDGAVADAPWVTDTCAAVFCSPFDDDAGVLPFNWDRVGPSAGTTAGILGTRSDFVASAPRALRVQTATAASLEQWLEKTFDTAKTGSIVVAMRVDAVAGPGSSLQFLALNCDTGGDAARVFLEADRKLSLSTAKGDATTTTFLAMPFKSWTGVRVDFAYDGNATVTSSLTFASATTPAVKFSECKPPFKVRLGATLASDAVFDVSFDDVAIDWQ